MADYVELYIDQGTDFETTIALADDNTNIATNVANYSVSAQLKKSLLSQNAYANLVCTITDPQNGELTISANANVTANIRSGNYFFDVKVKDNSNVTSRLIEGVIYVTPGITK